MKLPVAAILTVLAMFATTDGKVFTKCNLAKALSDNGFEREKLADWICLVQHESAFKTDRKNLNKNGSTDWGLFQINDKYWCDPETGTGYNECNAKCKDFVTDSIVDDLKCVKKIYKRHGFNAWYGWKNNCKGKTLPGVDHCF